MLVQLKENRHNESTGHFLVLFLVVQTLDSAIHPISTQWISIRVNNWFIHWIEIYPVDSAIQLLNNRALF